MPELTLQRIPFTVEADTQLRMLKARTGITPNILCRMGLCLSLDERRTPTVLPEHFKIGREINRYTLLGKYDHILIALLNTWMAMDKSIDVNINEMFLAHTNRGIYILSTRIKSTVDIHNLIQSNYQ